MELCPHEDLDDLVRAAHQSPRLRQHRNLHHSYEDRCQRLFNAVEIDSYIRPHRHTLNPKAESLFALRGVFALFTFFDSGDVKQIVRFGISAASAPNVGVILPPGDWHTVIALAPGSVMLEIKEGPFEPATAKELAPWAPDESSPEGLPYLRQLQTLARLQGG